MIEPLGKDNLREHLTAFADGELDAAQILAVLEYIRAEPEALDLLTEQQKLRVAAMRTVRATAPPVPPALRERIEALSAAAAVQPKPTPKSAATRAWASRLPWLLSAAVVLGILGGITIGYLALRPREPDGETTAAAPRYDVPPSTVAAVTGVHVDCSRFAARRHATTFPEELDGLSSAVKQDFNRDSPYPDLSNLGYKLIGAGPCRAPLADTVHLLYRSTSEDVNDTLSIFVRPADGEPNLDQGKFDLVSDSSAAHPMFAWRTARAVYFLVGDEMATTERARNAIAAAAKL